MNIKSGDVDYDLGCKFRFKREDLNDFCNNHPFTMTILSRYGYQYMRMIADDVNSSIWKQYYVGDEKKEKMVRIEFDNPDDELMFKLIY